MFFIRRHPCCSAAVIFFSLLPLSACRIGDGSFSAPTNTQSSLQCGEEFLANANPQDFDYAAEISGGDSFNNQKYLAQVFRSRKLIDLENKTVSLRLTTKKSSRKKEPSSAKTYFYVHIHEVDPNAEIVDRPGTEIASQQVSFDSLQSSNEWVSFQMNVKSVLTATGYQKSKLQINKMYMIIINLENASAGESVFWLGSRYKTNSFGHSSFLKILNPNSARWERLSDAKSFGYRIGC